MAMPRANSRGTNGNEMLISAVSFQDMHSTAVFCVCVCMQRHVNGCLLENICMLLGTPVPTLSK